MHAPAVSMTSRLPVLRCSAAPRLRPRASPAAHNHRRAAVCAAARACVSRPRRASTPLRALGDDGFESENPQNVPAPERGPSAALSPEDAVRIQLDAARANDTPRTDHGIHTLYDFCADAGDMERSRYFGISKDLYHLDHFLSIKSLYPALFRCDSFDVEPAAAGPGGCVDVRARVRAGGDEATFVFRMERREVGSKKGCWLVKQLLPAGSQYL